MRDWRGIARNSIEIVLKIGPTLVRTDLLNQLQFTWESVGKPDGKTERESSQLIRSWSIASAWRLQGYFLPIISQYCGYQGELTVDSL